MPNSGAYYQQGLPPTITDVSGALNQALTDQATLFFLIWILPGSYQVSSQLIFKYPDSQVWGSGTGTSGVNGATYLQPTQSLAGSDMWICSNSITPNAIDLKYIHFDGQLLTGVAITPPASGSPYTASATGLVRWKMTSPNNDSTITGCSWVPSGGAAIPMNTPGTINMSGAPYDSPGIYMYSGDTVTLTYAAGTGGAAFTMFSAPMNTYINIDAGSADNTHPINLAELSFTGNRAGGASIPVRISGCQEAWISRVFVDGFGYFLFQSNGGSCWIDYCNLAGLMYQGLTISILGGNVGAYGFWNINYVNPHGTTNSTLVCTSVHTDGPDGLPLMLSDNVGDPSLANANYSKWVCVGGIMTSSKSPGHTNQVNGFVSGQQPANMRVFWYGVEMHGGSNTVPWHAPQAAVSITGLPTVVTTSLSGTITSGQTNITTTGAAGFPAAPFYAQIANGQAVTEVVLVNSTGTGTNWNIARGQLGTPASSATGSTISLAVGYIHGTTPLNYSTGRKGLGAGTLTVSGGTITIPGASQLYFAPAGGSGTAAIIAEPTGGVQVNQGDQISFVCSAAPTFSYTQQAQAEGNVTDTNDNLSNSKLITNTLFEGTFQDQNLKTWFNKVVASSLFAQPTDPANGQTTEKMMGLALNFTPRRTGILMVTLDLDLYNSTALDGGQLQMRWGYTATPGLNDAVSGSTVGKPRQVTAVPSANGHVPASIACLISPVFVGVKLWIDVSLKNVTGGTAFIVNVNATVRELDS